MTLHIPDVLAPEREKYAAMWQQPDYKKYSPGLENVERFMKVIKPSPGETLLDIGCGAGVAGLEFEKSYLRVWWLDFTDAGLDDNVDRQRFIKASIWGSWRMRPAHGWDYGFCCDVLEHIPTEYTMLAVDRILHDCRTVWLQIAFDPDVFGQLIGKPLHMTVQPYSWWLARLASMGMMLDARDLCGSGVFVMERS